jgi:hypothetical protein
MRSGLAATHPKAAAEGPLRDMAAKLKLPMVGEDPRGTAATDGWAFMNYEDFARKARRMNKETAFTKDVIDAAFRKAVSRVASSALTRKGRIDGLLTRVSTQLLPNTKWCFC